MYQSFHLLRKTLWHPALLLFCASISIAAPVKSDLTPHVAEYKVKIKFLSGKLKTEVKATDAGYTAESVLRASGLARLFARGEIRENSEFSVNDGAVRPLRYVSVDSISKKGKSLNFNFDWDQKTVMGSINEQDFQLELTGFVYERVSIQYQLMLDLQNQSTREEYALLDDFEPKLLQVTTIEKKQIKVPFGKFEAVGIQHRKKGSGRVTTLWCVEELDYLPILIEQHRDGKLTVRAVLTRYQPTTSE